ncbi:hypothetical protein [Nocardia blacklockiae]|uniref:hypothetical protein n=1 Tax=Nocardia blacklockiae TaxID=480036 RepID=UPI001894A458|nr:hypothetical protein [Nocardia blacklockiae]MBF6175758.1 hypothetical protein [Nocardia blacklockiae]
MSREQWETPEEQAIRRKNRRRMAVVGPLAVLAVAIAVVAYVRNPEDGGTAPPPIAPAFVGSWQGVADDGRDSFDVVLTINGEGAPEVATSSTVNKTTGARCDRAERVVAGNDTELTLAARSSGNAGCDDDARATVQLHSDGTLAYRTGAPGSTITGTLHK